MRKRNLLVLLAGSLLLMGTVNAEDRISAVHAFPETLIYTKSFLGFVDKVNEAGKGVVQIDVRGGPEAIGMLATGCGSRRYCRYGLHTG